MVGSGGRDAVGWWWEWWMAWSGDLWWAVSEKKFSNQKAGDKWDRILNQPKKRVNKSRKAGDATREMGSNPQSAEKTCQQFTSGQVQNGGQINNQPDTYCQSGGNFSNHKVIELKGKGGSRVTDRARERIPQ